MHILDSLLAFSAYFFIGVAMVIIFLFIYSKITPHNEWQLIKNNNTAAALSFSWRQALYARIKRKNY